jgi:ribosomal protein L40E
MRLTPEQQQQVSRHLNTRGTAPKCPVCGASNLRVKKNVVALPTPGSPTGSRHLVAVECRYCGYVLHFSPGVMDLDLGDDGSAPPSA